MSNQRCHDVTVSTLFQRNSTDLASARTTKRTSSLRTDVQISKKGALVIVYVSIVIFIIRSLQRRGHGRVQAIRDSMVTSTSRWPKLTSWATSSSQGMLACWSRREMSFLFGSAVFFFCDSILNLFWQFFSKKLLSLSAGGFECMC